MHSCSALCHCTVSLTTTKIVPLPNNPLPVGAARRALFVVVKAKRTKRSSVAICAPPGRGAAYFALTYVSGNHVSSQVESAWKRQTISPDFPKFAESRQAVRGFLSQGGKSLPRRLIRNS